MNTLPVGTASRPTPHTGITITSEFAHALDLLQRGGSIFLTGKAGTGKSTLIRHFLAQTDRNALTVAPTGIAALNVGGYTIHRLFSFTRGINEETVRFGNYYPRRFAKALRGLDILIVDEVSMVRADLFDAMVAALERFGPRPGTPFGGVQLVLVGDLYQLPPVVQDAESAFIAERFGTPYFFSARSFSREVFPVIELTTVFRQIGDTRLVEILNAVREGALLEGARAELNRRTHPEFEPDLDEFWLTLATTNRIVGARNRQMLERLGTPPRAFLAGICGETDGFEYPADERLTLAVGAQVMLLNNDASGRWVNGSIGRVVRMGYEEDGPVVGVMLREGRTVDVRPHRWDITRPEVRGGSLVHEVVGSFTQLPMKLAWAITIHKSQGQTLDRVVVDLTGGTFANGQLYVALSRCTSLDGLVLKRDVLPRDLKSDILVRRFLHGEPVHGQTLGRAYLAALTVGNEGDRYRPRPIEIAVVTDDGDEATTVVNPTSDLYSAQREFGLTTRDISLAPVLREAWAALAPLLAGRTPTGVGVDRTLGLIDFELKRNGQVEAMPLGAELPDRLLSGEERAALRAPTALERARAMRRAGERLEAEAPRAMATLNGTAFSPHHLGSGYLLARTTGPDGRAGPEGFVVGGLLAADSDPAQILADHLTRAWERLADRDGATVTRMREVERYFGVQVLPGDFELGEAATAESALVPGARVCFTGEVADGARGYVSREEMYALALRCGLMVSENMTKTRTDVLVVAQRGTQSGKAKKAAQWGKPVLAAEDFLTWATATGRPA